jgi:DNA-binding NarL/FixJ family response regulator
MFSGDDGPPDLVVMDLGMPGMGGHKAMKAILRLAPGTMVLIASGYSVDDQVRAALESGAAGYVAKPYKRADLLVTVRKVLEGR